MFGYVTINQETLPEDRVKRYRAYYCGLCRTLKARHGNIGRMTLSYDLTFLYILLSSLHEPEETDGEATCPTHPVKPQPFVENEAAAYAADMNIALAYHKGLDNWQDERKASGLAQSRLLAKAYQRVAAQHPDTCRVIEECLRDIHQIEQSQAPNVDALANLTGRMLGEIYRAYRPDDPFAGVLWDVGSAMGRFIYMMDAYEDLPGDQRKQQYNPLVDYATHEDYEALCQEGLSMLIAECAEAFEILPLMKDVDILRNILYSGVWTHYAAIQKKKEAKEKEKA